MSFVPNSLNEQLSLFDSFTGLTARKRNSSTGRGLNTSLNIFSPKLMRSLTRFFTVKRTPALIRLSIYR